MTPGINLTIKVAVLLIILSIM